MKSRTYLAKDFGTTIELPTPRKGGSTETMIKDHAAQPVTGIKQSGNVDTVLQRFQNDENYKYLSQRLQEFAVLADSKIDRLRQAIGDKNVSAVAYEARDLTDYTGRFGALRMMRLCIAIQMLGRRNLLDKANIVLQELELEYLRFKEGLLNVG